MATRSRALLVLIASGFGTEELADTIGVSGRMVDKLKAGLRSLRGDLKPDPEFAAAVDSYLTRAGIPRPQKQAGIPSARDRVELAFRDHPGASLDELVRLSGTSVATVRRVLGDRGPVKSHAQRARERRARRPLIVEAVRTSSGESAASIARRIGLSEDEVRGVVRELASPPPRGLHQ